jgi:hypothetical protein
VTSVPFQVREPGPEKLAAIPGQRLAAGGERGDEIVAQRPADVPLGLVREQAGELSRSSSGMDRSRPERRDHVIAAAAERLRSTRRIRAPEGIREGTAAI